MELEQAARQLESLGNPTRLAIFRTLVRAGPDGLPVGTLKSTLDVPGSTLSHHISHLVREGLLIQERSGRQLLCAPKFPAMRELVDFLYLECCCGDECPVANPSNAAALAATDC